MKKFLSIFLLILILVFSFSCLEKSNSTVIAKVNGKNITIDDLEDEINNLPAQYKMLANNPQMKRRILDNLITKELLLQEAERKGVLNDPEIKNKIKEYKITLKQDIEAQMYELKKRKEKIDKIAKMEVVLNELVNNSKYRNVAITNDELKKSYNNYVNDTKKYNPNAKVKKFDEIKGDIRKSLEINKWINNLKQKADIVVYDDKLGFTPKPNTQLKISPEKNTNKK